MSEKTNKLQEAYTELNDRKKNELKEAFTTKFELSTDTFYRKINGSSPLWNYEKHFFSEWFKISVKKLFTNTKKEATQ